MIKKFNLTPSISMETGKEDLAEKEVFEDFKKVLNSLLEEVSVWDDDLIKVKINGKIVEFDEIELSRWRYEGYQNFQEKIINRLK